MLYLKDRLNAILSHHTSKDVETIRRDTD
ncbi:MAG: ATP-dependent Clp protease proteolytic subunit, partial [Acidobacteria bacterium]|nr:ATP-dependent Clp protease proteolytic subunit [Acidobacteriota bacterium]